MIAILFFIFSILAIYKLYILYLKTTYSCLLNNNNIEMPDQYLINLDKKPDRLKNSKCRLNKMGFYPRRFSAVNGKELDLNGIVVPSAMKSIINGHRLEHHELSVGAVGCAISHFQIWKKLLGYDKIYVFEDDTVPMFSMDVCNQYIKMLPDDWDIFLMGGLYNETNKVFSDLFGYLGVTRVYKFYCLHGYLIKNSKNVENILKQAYPISKQIDSWLSDLAFTNKINIYGVVNNRWVQTNEGTDIQTPVTQLFMNIL